MSIEFTLYLPPTNVESDTDLLRDWFQDAERWFKILPLPIESLSPSPHVPVATKQTTGDCEGDAQSEAPGLRIGTHAQGWVFLLEAYPKLGIHDLDDWIRLWNLPGAEIRNDSGFVLTAEEMLNYVKDRPRLRHRLPVIDDEAPPVKLVQFGRRFHWENDVIPERCRAVHFEKVYGRWTRPSEDRWLLVPASATDPDSGLVGKFGDTYRITINHHS